ncbi:MAG: Transcriptional regulator, TetR family [Microbacteriaceae bacterium]|jgi:AcrR family transcriptional regulator|nr:Transcriptional regulator, TetR family [Microbacteriaceae bacterium]
MSDVRERIIATAYPLFVDRSVRHVTVTEILIGSGATRIEFDRQFDSRDELAEECLGRREREWTRGLVEAGARAREGGATAELQLLVIFDFFDDWFNRDDHACHLVNVLLETGREHPLGKESILHLLSLRNRVTTLAAEAELVDLDAFAMSWDVLMKGAIIGAADGDQDAAIRARAMAEDLIHRHRPPSADAELDWWMDHGSGSVHHVDDSSRQADASLFDFGYLQYPQFSWAED